MEITFAALDVRLRAAIMASVNTTETDHENPALWGAALTLEGAAYGRLTERLAHSAYQADPSEENRSAFIESAATDCAVAFWSTAGEPWRA